MTLLPLSATAQRGDPVAIGKGGRGRGVREGGWSVFRGIRYGADVTRRRFQAPVALPLARDILLATAFGPSCPQRGGSDLTQAKDCWFLDIWTPDARAGANHPVIFPQRRRFGRTVIEPLVFGQHWAPRDVVVATVNHRLNALGYLYFDRLATRFADSGNAGQPDLILALQWARDNIYRVRWQRGPHDGVWPVWRRRQDRDADGDARRARVVSFDCDDERAAGDGVRAGQRDGAVTGMSRPPRIRKGMRSRRFWAIRM